MSVPPAKLSFSFGSKAKPKPTMSSSISSQPAQAKPTGFSGFGGDDDDDDAPAPAESSSSKSKSKKGPPVYQASKPSRAQLEKQEKAMEVDKSVFEYDEVWDRMKEGERKAKEAKLAEDAHRQPKYMGAAIASAATRKLDRLRAEEKLLEKERAEEGDMYAGTEKFVTQAYKDQQAEVRRAEEEEKKREESLKKSSTKGMSAMYSAMLSESSKAHEAAVAASLSAPSPANLTISKPQEDSTESNGTQDSDLVKEAKKQGLDVEVNDSGEIVDSRDLLKPGLNIIPTKPKTSTLDTIDPRPGSGSSYGPHGGVSRRVGASTDIRDIRQRQDRLLREQYREEELRKEKEEAERKKEREVGIKDKRNDESSVMDATARYLARKKAKLEEEEKAAAAAASGGTGSL